MRWMLYCLTGLLCGCSTTRQIMIQARPPDAAISVDGVDLGHGPIRQTITFKADNDLHRITASRAGYVPQTVELTSTYDQPELTIELQPQTKQVTVHVTPMPATVILDGKPVRDEPVQDVIVTLPFSVNEKNEPVEHVVRASRPGYQTAEQILRWDDQSDQCTLALDAVRKDLTITTTPAGAQVSLDGRLLGDSPLTARSVAFPIDPKTGRYKPQTLTASKSGYDPAQTTINWDEGRAAYHLDLPPKSKTVRITTDPPGAVVRIEGRELPRDTSGVSTTRLAFPPVDDRGELKTYTAVASKKTAQSEWLPRELTIRWDNGKADYSVTLQEEKTQPVALIRPVPVRTDEGWHIEPQTVQTLAMKDVTEGPTTEPPVRIIEAPGGTVIDTLAVSPDGQWLAFTTLSGRTRADFRSQIQLVRTDGSGSPRIFGDGNSLDLMPAFMPDGSQLVFSSSRGGKRMSIWQIGASGEGGVTQLTGGDTTDLWPTVDSGPTPRLFYEALIDSRPDPRLYLAPLGTTLRTDLTQVGGEQPRVGPKADAVVFTLADPKTGKRDIYRMSDRGGAAANLTNLPDFDNFDPAWSKDGSKIAFASDRGADSDGRHNFDIWALDLLHPDKPHRITSNGSWDDCPAWDPRGKYIYFRSNRGGDWGIWRVNAR